MNAIKLYRIGRWCYIHKVPLIPKLMHGLTFLIYNSHIPPSADIGRGTVFAYGAIGTVIHSRAVIGANCIIGSNVTIGSKSAGSGPPTIGSSVYIATGAKILGGIVIGDGFVIGANAVVTHDVMEKCMVYGVPARVIRQNIDVNDVSTHIRKDTLK